MEVACTTEFLGNDEVPIQELKDWLDSLPNNVKLYLEGSIQAAWTEDR